jgi:hypothetical protein
LLIELYFENREVLGCKITDNGVGRRKSAELRATSLSLHKSMGLSITEERLKLLYDSNKAEPAIRITDIVLPDGAAGGTEVLLRIPVRLQHDQSA